MTCCVVVVVVVVFVAVIGVKKRQTLISVLDKSLQIRAVYFNLKFCKKKSKNGFRKYPPK